MTGNRERRVGAYFNMSTPAPIQPEGSERRLAAIACSASRRNAAGWLQAMTTGIEKGAINRANEDRRILWSFPRMGTKARGEGGGRVRFHTPKSEETSRKLALSPWVAR